MSGAFYCPFTHNLSTVVHNREVGRGEPTPPDTIRVALPSFLEFFLGGFFWTLGMAAAGYVMYGTWRLLDG